MTIVQSALIFELPTTEFLLGGEERGSKKKTSSPGIKSENPIRLGHLLPQKKKNRKNERNISGKHHQIYLRLESTNLDVFFLKISPYKKFPSSCLSHGLHRASLMVISVKTPARVAGRALQWSTWSVFFPLRTALKTNIHD